VRAEISMRWWLAVAFAAIAAATMLLASALVDFRSERAFRERGQAIAAGKALQAAIAISSDGSGRPVSAAVRAAEAQLDVALWVFDEQGRLLSAPRSRRVDLTVIPTRRKAVAAALAGDRFVSTNDEVQGTIVALPLDAGDTHALLAYAPHPQLAQGLGILREEIVIAGLWAVALGGAIGLLVATLIARRLRRIALAAAAIERGDFDRQLRPRFPDELGALASSFDRMRVQLRGSFSELESERNRLRQLLERLQEGVIAVRPGPTVDVANGAARRLLAAPELAEGDAVPDPWPAFSLPDFACALLAGNGPLAEATVALDDDRVYRVVGVAASSPADAAVIVVTDTSERERQERAEREFVANAAHELRTPLTTILGAVDALRAGAQEDPEQRERFVSHVEREASRLARLTRSLLVLARAQTGQEEPRLEAVELRPLFEAVSAQLRPAPGVQIDVDCPSDLCVLAQDDLLEQIVTNLGANAVKHTLAGRIRMAGWPGGKDEVVIEVSDTGGGIAAADRERVLERFYRANGRDPDGFGLGLAIVRQAAEALGGSVALLPAPGGGTAVRVTLRGAPGDTS
jgi:signal transduction histidine kinase/HAMP domain-containing protein